ncbi:MAG: efflux RND transporter periplasmic adaptor subunit [Anaerolineae bacterium]|nr:efflux RND transporter periplasmic adaptor subunit [Anaerolineae bacterium]NUQ06961.1 efflux RND transporter periplasmic adaptor subunit [Anaerolineae bacterium]
MRASRILLLLIVLSVAVPVGVAVYASTQTAQTTATVAQLPAISDAQLEQIAAARGVTVEEVRQRMAAMQASGTVPQFAVGDTAAAAEQAATLALLGTVQSDETAALSFQRAGDVAEVLVEDGQSVTAGTVLARLETTAAQRTADDARLNLENAQISLQGLLDPPTEAEIEQARLAVVSAQASYSDAAGSTSDLQVQTAQLRLQQAQESYDLAVQKRANMNGTPEELALQDAAVGAASFNLEIARLNLQDLQTPSNQGSIWSAGLRVQMAELEYEQALSGASQSQIEGAELSVRVAELNLADAETDLARSELVAPIDGVITALNIEPGTSVSTALSAIEITDLSTLWLSAPLHELDLDQVAEGMAAEIAFDALPDETFAATLRRIDWIGVETDGIVEYTAWFALETGDSRIRPGMTGEAVIRLSGAA